MPRCYISGPMRGIPKHNFPAFDKARDLGVSLGWEVISPADRDRQRGITTETELSTITDPASSRMFARVDINILLNDLQAEKGDAIAMLPGWERSKGALAELAVARWVGLPILSALDFRPLYEHDPYLYDLYVTQQPQTPCYDAG